MSDYNSVTEHKMDGPRSCASCSILESERDRMKAELEEAAKRLEKMDQKGMADTLVRALKSAGK